MFPLRSARGVDRGGLTDDQCGLDRKQSGRRFRIDARHHFEVWRDMDVSEALQDRASAPVGQSVKGKVYHHRARTRPERRDVAFEWSTGGIGSDQCSENELRVHVGDNRASRLEAASVRQSHPARASGTDVDPRDGSAEDQRRAPRFQRGGHRVHDCVCPAFANHHAKGLVDHAFEIGKQRASGDVGREIEVQSPSRHHCLDLRVREPRVQEIPRARQEETQRLEQPPGPSLPPRLPNDFCSGDRGHRGA